MKSSDIHIRAISHDMPQSPITKICLKITYLKFHSNFPEANELIITSHDIPWNVITYPCNRYILLVHNSSYNHNINNTTHETSLMLKPFRLISFFNIKVNLKTSRLMSFFNIKVNLKTSIWRVFSHQGVLLCATYTGYFLRVKISWVWFTLM